MEKKVEKRAEEKVEKKEHKSEFVRISLSEEGKEVARAFLFLISNDLHDRPYGLMEDVFVEESRRGRGYGKKIVNAVIEEAKRKECYKLIGTSRYERKSVHDMYKNMKFSDYGKEFRLNLQFPAIIP